MNKGLIFTYFRKVYNTKQIRETLYFLNDYISVACGCIFFFFECVHKNTLFFTIPYNCTND